MSMSESLKLKRYTRPVEYEVAIFRDVMVTARDGVRLAVDIYFPSRNGVPVEGDFPAILDCTPYDKTQNALVANDPEFFAKRGYVFVFADSRGHFASFPFFIQNLYRFVDC